MNEPTDPETRVFKTNHFSFYGSILPDDLYITATCDPAGEGEDFTAITVVGTDNNMDMHILEIVNQNKMPPSDIVEKLITHHYKYKFRMLGLEKNFYRGMLRKALEQRIAEERRENPTFRLFGIHEFNPSGRKGEGKYNRIMALQPYHERGVLKFPGNKVELLQKPFSDLAYQMIQFPHSAHDDILDSLAYHLPLVHRGGVVKKQGPPRMTPAWLERRGLDEEVKLRKRVPRRLRRALGQLAFS
jgi:predicted phage terminase large subunit-like protein